MKDLEKNGAKQKIKYLRVLSETNKTKKKSTFFNLEREGIYLFNTLFTVD